VDRARLVTASPVQDDRGRFKRSLERVLGSAIVLGAAALKWAFVFGKFFAFFVSFALYSALFHSWEFGLGLVLLILVHEMGHYAEAKRQHIHVTLPTFVPFLGAYVMTRREHLSPWGSALVSLAGPFVGSVGAAAAWAASPLGDAQLLVGLANIGFLLNAFNLLPIGFLDGGTVFRAIGDERRPRFRFENSVPVGVVEGDRRRALVIAALYLLLAGAVVAGMLATKQNGASF
jgi:membrane-associated protease RseP (regulator of RpoE activity)